MDSPPKVRLFLWRLCREGLATKERISARGIKSAMVYNLCGVREESATHLFAECCWTKRVWFLSPLGWGSHLQKMEKISEWMLKKGKKEPKSVIILLASIMWSIWLTRNNLAFKDWEPNPLATCERVMSILTDYQHANKVESKNKQQQIWSPPSRNFVKINTNTTRLGEFS